MKEEVFKYYHGRLPQWRFAGAVYFITLSTKNIELTRDERKIVYDAILHWHGKRYTVLCFTVMPDHAHIVCTFGDEEKPSDLSKVMQSIKAHIAREINRTRERYGAFWEREFFNRILRDDKELYAKMEYIYSNPYRAEIAIYPEKYPFSWFSDEIEE